jgi:hypothetical protein
MFGNLLSVFNLGFPIQFRTTFRLIEDAHKRRVHLEFDHVLPDFFRHLLVLNTTSLDDFGDLCWSRCTVSSHVRGEEVIDRDRARVSVDHAMFPEVHLDRIILPSNLCAGRVL